MIGELFTINLDNVVRAAMADVMKDVKWDAPVAITARPHDTGIDALILVTGTGPASDAYEIVVRESMIADCLRDEDIRVAAQDLVGQLAAEIRGFVDEVLG